MSLQTTFAARAAAAGLKVPHLPSHTKGSTDYTTFRSRQQDLRARVDAGAQNFLRGRALIPGRDPRALGARSDSSGKPVNMDRLAKSEALVWEWANALARLENDGVRADALVPMASQALTFFYDQVYEIQHANLPAWEGKFLRIDRRPDPASESIVWYEKDLVGVARAASSYSTKDIPMVGGPAAQANYLNVIPYLVGMEMNFMDLRREALGVKNGKPDFQIFQSKVAACQRVIAEAINFMWMFGDSQSGVDGLMNNPNIFMIQTVGAWSGKTSLQILDDLQTYAQAIPNRTQGQLGDYSKLRILLPPTQFDRANNLPVTSAGSVSVISYFQNNYKGIKIEKEYSLAAANSQLWIGGPQGLAQDRAVIIYDEGDDSADAMFVLPQPIEIPSPPRQNGLSETTFFHARAAGAKIPDARRVVFAEGL